MNFLERFIGLLLYYASLATAFFIMGYLWIWFLKKLEISKTIMAVIFFGHLSIVLIHLLLNTIPAINIIFRFFLFGVLLFAIGRWLKSNSEKVDYYYEELRKRIPLPKRD